MLSVQQSSGVLYVEGNPGGTVYFDAGLITFARASWIPDLNARLRGSLPRRGEWRELLADAERPDRDIGTLLVRRHYLTADELGAILRSVIVDAVIALTAQAGEDSFVSDLRFVATDPHWAGAYARLPVDAVRAEAAAWAERTAGCGLARTTQVRLRDLTGPSAVLNRKQWAIACAVDGAASAQELAWRCGVALCEVIECVGYLIQAGLAAAGETRPLAPAAGPLAQRSGLSGTVTTLAQVPVVTQAPAGAELPRRGVRPPLAAPVTAAALETEPPPAPPRRGQQARRTPGTRTVKPPPVMTAPVSTADAHPPSSADFTPAPSEILRRVLDGLRKNS
jgi:uncharacterized protein DUF4388